MGKAKSFDISKLAVRDAYIRVKRNNGGAGVDVVSLGMFEEDLENNLYKIWNRMSSGSYFPPPVRTVLIPKPGGTRTLGIPTVADRIAQMTVKLYLEPELEPVFDEDSYGYRPGKSALDAWMRRTYPGVPFERYADDIVIHCKSEEQTLSVHRNLIKRMTACKLELHPEKTKIAYCKDVNRRGNYDTVSFDFLGYTFRPRMSKNRWGKYFVNFSPAISRKAVVRIFGVIRNWQFNSRTPMDLEDLAELVNPAIQGWLNYYGRFCPSAMHSLMMHLNQRLVKWAMRKYKRFRFHEKRATHWLGRIAHREPGMFVHWRFGYKPSTGQ